MDQSVPEQTPWYADKTFLTVILVPLLNLLAKKLGLDLNIDAIIAQTAAVIAFIVMHKWAGAQKAKAAATATSATQALLTEQSKEKQLDMAKDLLQSAVNAQKPTGMQ